MSDSSRLLHPPSTVRFADVAHQALIFDRGEESERLVLELVDTKWVQRLRNVSQTGNTNLVYMFAEHSRFGHSLGVAYLSCLLMKSLKRFSPEQIAPYQNAVAAAAILHDVGHVAPGSHLGERIWAPDDPAQHEEVSIRIIREDNEISEILARYDTGLAETVCAILSGSKNVPPWTSAIISGGGWNADRGNWAIVDSEMCAVTYGRYNVMALIDAYRLSDKGELILHESRLDALTHFFVARDSMYRQVYQHRTLQAADALSKNIVLRLRDIIAADSSENIAEARESLSRRNIFADDQMLSALFTDNYAEDLPLETLFQMNENWWGYHVHRWCQSEDEILSDLSSRLRARKLFKTVRLENRLGSSSDKALNDLIEQSKEIAKEIGLDPRYYVAVVDDTDKHRGKSEPVPGVLLDSGEIVPVTSVEPMIAKIIEQPEVKRTWIAVPKRVKEKLGRVR